MGWDGKGRANALESAFVLEVWNRGKSVGWKFAESTKNL